MVAKLHLSPTTLHTSVNYLDRILATAAVPQARVLEVAAACLLIAGKFEEMNSTTPFISDVVRAADCVAAARLDRTGSAAASGPTCWSSVETGTLSPEALSRAEMLVLQHLKWRMRVASRLHFLSLYRDLGLTLPSDAIDARALIPADKTFVGTYAKFFCDLAVQDPALIHHPNSVAAAAAVAAARDVAGVTPVWPAALAGQLCQTMGQEEALAACYQQMCATFRRDFDQPEAKRAGFGLALAPAAARDVIDPPVIARLLKRGGACAGEESEEESVATPLKERKRRRMTPGLGTPSNDKSPSTVKTSAGSKQTPGLGSPSTGDLPLEVVLMPSTVKTTSGGDSPSNVVLAMEKWGVQDTESQDTGVPRS